MSKWTGRQMNAWAGGKNEALKHPWEEGALLPSLLGATRQHAPSGMRRRYQRDLGKTLILPPEPKPTFDVFLLTQTFLLTGSTAKPCSRKSNYGA